MRRALNVWQQNSGRASDAPLDLPRTTLLSITYDNPPNSRQL